MEIAGEKKDLVDASDGSHFCSLRGMHVGITIICRKLYVTQTFFFKPFLCLLSPSGFSSTFGENRMRIIISTLQRGNRVSVILPKTELEVQTSVYIFKSSFFH